MCNIRHFSWIKTIWTKIFSKNCFIEFPSRIKSVHFMIDLKFKIPVPFKTERYDHVNRSSRFMQGKLFILTIQTFNFSVQFSFNLNHSHNVENNEYWARRRAMVKSQPPIFDVRWNLQWGHIYECQNHQWWAFTIITYHFRRSKI